MRGKLATIIDRVEHGHHVFAYFKHAFLKQYEKFATYLRNELVSNNLADFHLRKGLDHLNAVRERVLTITDRFAGFQAQWLNVHVDFPLLQRLALPITVGAVRYPGIKLHDPRASACPKSSCTVAATSVAGQPGADSGHRDQPLIVITQTGDRVMIERDEQMGIGACRHDGQRGCFVRGRFG